MKILLIEDNKNISKGLQYTFEERKDTFLVASTKQEAIAYLKTNSDIDLILLDITLPDGNGFTLFEEEIKKTAIPTLFLTANDEEDAVVKGLNMGAEDYITKPFSTKELIARIEKIIRREKKNSVITIQKIALDIDKMEVTKEGKKLDFTPIEMKILLLLFLNRNKTVRRDTLLDAIWEMTGNDVDNHTITVYLKRIREKLGIDLITTVKGIGYRIDDGK